ncbi:uncharacterized protein CEXT_346181 [Caerostris extrusa]|uniref:Ionotropic glutamate receptor L-glutamate and glycine-binding domain-containing protein n=1 Tax=Caerostris extrusa TaxID=172846 RepID=A0AAV4WDK9_CAEEX|nr:uncharacterized protein CEXT_346181 [Caerostris extrusa]
MDPLSIKVATVIVKRQLEVQKLKEGKVEFGGLDGKFLEVILEALKVPYEFVFPADDEWGRLFLPDGNWTGMVGKVQTGEADIAMNFIMPTQERMQIADFTPAYSIDEITFAIGKPGLVSPTLAFVYPFPFTLWWICIGFLFLMPLIFLFLLDKRYSLIFLFLQTFSSILRQPLMLHSCISVIPNRTFRRRTYSEFQGTFRSSVRGSHKCFISKGSSNLKILLSSEIDYMKTLGKAVEQNNWYYAYDEVIGSNYINPYSAAIGPKSMLQINSGAEISASMHVSSDSLNSATLAIPMRKNFPLKKKLCKIISSLNSAGIYKKFLKDESLRVWLTRQNEASEIEAIKPLQISDISGPLILLLAGYVLSIVVF